MAKRAFIVRPFGIKEGIDFDAIEALLIQPALARTTVIGATTAEIAEAGNIREDMFRLLVTADLVIADLSIHNANVFYELGIRHGLRPRGTLLIRADKHAYPFDLQTDRFLLYDAQAPAAAVGRLAEAIHATLASTGTDSPVYKMLPRLPPPSSTVLRVVPQDFRDAVDYAQRLGYRGDLELLAHEAQGLEWASEGLRTVGRAQFAIAAWHGARETFEALCGLVPGDIEAHQRLATIYQKLGDLVRSSQAIQDVIDSTDASPWDRAEAFALQGRNAKVEWANALDAAPADRGAAALRNPLLSEAISKYTEGFQQDLNHFYSGLNGLSLLRIRNDLAAAHPTVWGESFDTDDDAQRALRDSQAQFQQLAGAVQMSVQARLTFLERQQPRDEEQLMWARISHADHTFATATTPRTVRRRYAEALGGSTSFGSESVRAQLEIFQKLRIRSEYVVEALSAVEEAERAAGGRTSGAPRQKSMPPARVLLFTGHMIDLPTRSSPRFPPTVAAEQEARRMIRKAIEEERALEAGRVVGVAGGACGGDILFHELCEEMGLETRLFLALPQHEFSATSVQHGGKEWVERFNRLCARIPPRVLAENDELPAWLRLRRDYDLWQRNNLWMLFNALALEARSLTLIALWDKDSAADGPGGTGDLVAQVTRRGYKIDRLPAENLRALSATS